MEFWLDIAAFAVKAGLIVAAIGALVFVISRVTRDGEDSAPDLKVTCLNDHYEDMEARLSGAVLDKKAVKALAKVRKKAAKAQKGPETGKRLYVLAFEGDVKASAVTRLGNQVDALLTLARPGQDEIVVKVDSPGGTVNGYGLAATQLLRLRDAGLALTVCVDQVGASGGYLMACTANKILAAPFAIVGSIGVVAQVPNLHRLLKKNDIDFEEITAGEFKRSVSLLGEITPAGREHFRGKLDATHVAFKDFVARYRPALKIDEVANGDYWYGSEAIGLGLVDELMASDDYLFRARTSARLFSVTSEERKPLLKQLLEGLGFAFDAAVSRLWRKTGPGGV